jgi:hypothetical protein
MSATPLLSLMFSNVSSVEWSRYDHDRTYSYTVDTAISWMSNLPESTLAANGGGQNMIMSVNSRGDLDQGQEEIICSWYFGEEMFGLKLKFPVQVLTLGDSPYWEIVSGSLNPSPDFSTSGSNPADIYNFPTLAGCSITATPTADENSLLVSVLIQDAT